MYFNIIISFFILITYFFCQHKCIIIENNVFLSSWLSPFDYTDLECDIGDSYLFSFTSWHMLKIWKLKCGFQKKQNTCNCVLKSFFFDTIALQDLNLIFSYSFVEIQGRGLVMSFITVVLHKATTGSSK